jgi:phenylalanyl-tRNA synthetase alpha chain
LNSEDLTEEQKKSLELLKTRQDVLKISERKEITLVPTGEGIKLGESSSIGETISQLTPELLISKGWKSMKFREYDVNTFVTPEKPAKRHPLQKLIDEIRGIFVELGFEEISGNLLESAFWNFDALFVAQDHPARDMHDTFYLKEPKVIEIPKFMELKDRIKKTHEKGGTTGSSGWGGLWNENIAKKTLLRTHTTAVTARYLSGLKKNDPPRKVFSIGKVFRNEAVDYKHLPEFYQVEGIIVDEKVNFRHLLGILKEFYDRMGFSVRFRPGYFPYTEMSIEPEIYLKERDEWIELGGAGIFRPEVVKPLFGFDCPVLAWGLGLDRVAALRLGLSDIRTLYW